MATINARIDADGNLHVEVNGVQGSGCEDLTRLLLQAVGDVEETRLTEEHVQELPDYINAQGE